ncbi:MAG: hypothetical protein CME65_14875 [Halobacteriovoraceae bacterium]|nr:hypothetical protein [Halobacteriovoraceae bacterium]|tara:strand:+ start:4230 stop:5123 length:894 start_codon:yes stop_codon:yes gene_type:complete
MSKWILLLAFATLSVRAFADARFVTYNIRHFDSNNNSTNKTELKKILDNLNADFITVQEIVNTSSFLTFMYRNYSDYKVVFSRCGGLGRQKIGFVYNSKKYELEDSYEDARFSDPRASHGNGGCGRLRPVLVGHFKEKRTGKSFVSLGVHLKAGGRSSSYRTRRVQYEILTDLVKDLNRDGHKDVIVMGDFNTTGYILNDSDYHNFSDMLGDLRMSSGSSRLNCTSYWSGSNRSDNIEESSVLDHILYSSTFMGMRAKSIEVHSHCARAACENTSARSLGTSYREVTDHCPVSITFN